MRHGKRFNQLKRKKGHRDATLMNMSNALIKHKRIFTTLAKAKALRKHVEPIITKSKTNTTHSRRVVFSYLKNKNSVDELFSIIAAKIGDRPGGYLRVMKTGFRPSDGAELAMIEFVDFNELYTGKHEAAETGGRRRRRRTRRGGSGVSSSGGAVKTAASATAVAAAATKAGGSDEEE
ncbi:MAG: 50S ribosomal protein L17 [Saprospirales bacterium]|nr:MAG: 50S ribosomal protein L17 [Saprospirales bacterium]